METQANDDNGNEPPTYQREFGPGSSKYGPDNGKFKRGSFVGPPWRMKKGMMMRKNMLRTRALIIGSTVILAGLILATRGSGRHRHFH